MGQKGFVLSRLKQEAPLDVLDLFSGIGGFSLGLGKSGLRTVAFCEIDPFARRVLAKHWPGIPCYEDIRTITAERLAQDGITADSVCGGFPCHPFSTASRGRRTAVSLWPEYLRVVADIRPRAVIVENVQKQAISLAEHDLRSLGYGCDVRRISASDAGGDHKRDRWWLSAHADDQGQLRGLVDAEVAKLPALCAGLWGPANYAGAVRVPDGLPNRMDRLRCLGNAVIPAIPEALGRAILAAGVL